MKLRAKVRFHGANRVYSYAVVERALIDAFDIGKDGQLAFRARLRNLQRLGLTPETPGSGKRVQYSLSDIYDLAFALNLAEFGLDPKKIVAMVTRGQIFSLKETQNFCVFNPTTFSKTEKPLLMFVDKNGVADLATGHRRVAIVNIGEIRFLVGAHTWEGPGNVSP